MTERAHITLVVDRSGSMSSMATEANAGIKKFIEDQAKIEGVETYISLVQFDDEYEHVFGPVLASEAPKYEIGPRAMTALYDAIGRSIRDTKQWVGSPHDKVVIVIMTDGIENASKEFTSRESITKAIEQAKAEADWQFIFLAGTLESARMATNSGMRGQTMSYDPNVRGQTFEAYNTASANTTAFLSGAAATTVMPESLEDDDAP
jgi:Mg-chelatase subunit ChlD